MPGDVAQGLEPLLSICDSRPCKEQTNKQTGRASGMGELGGKGGEVKKIKV